MMLRASGLAAILLSAFFTPASAQPLPAAKEHVNSIGMKLVRVEAGEFRMGQGDAPPKSRDEWLERDGDEAPAHLVKIGSPFHLGAQEVTNAQYERFDPKHKELRGKFGVPRADDEPVTFVTWKEAVDFCAWLSKMEKLPYRLPTEAEWEYACRAGTTTAYSTGDMITAEQANIGVSKRRIGPFAVDTFPANAWGLFNMHGNVAEWCHDWYGPYEAGPQSDPVGRADGWARVVRGWSWEQPSYQKTVRFARSANRAGHLPEDANRYTGFRVALGKMPATAPLPVAEPPLNQRDVKQTPAAVRGPDPEKPYFVDYAKDKKNPTIPPNTWGPIFSNHNHFSTTCVCPNGDVLAVWYTCVGESDRQLAQAASRLRVGADRWEPASFFFGVPDVNTHAPVLLRDGARIYHFCTQSLAGWDYATDIVRWSDNSGATWSKPRIMVARTAADALSQPCSAFVAKDGTIVVACDGDNHKDERLLVSTDRGETWKVAKGDMRRAVGGKYAIHPAIVPRSDGAILSFLRGPDPMPMLITKDRGDTWEQTDSPFPGISVGQKACALKLASGAIAFLTIDKTKRLGGTTILALSLDDGRTWAHARKVEAPVSGYMSLSQGPDGTIYLVGSQLKCAACNEAWIREGKEWR